MTGKPELPSGGGSYVRNKDGSLKQVEATKPAPPRAPGAKPAPAPKPTQKGS
ncbi:MAG: hypothetical protein ACP5DX_04120 [Paracoccaceae bacterium]